MASINVRTCWRESVIVLAVIGRVYSPDEVPQRLIIRNQIRDVILLG